MTEFEFEKNFNHGFDRSYVIPMTLPETHLGVTHIYMTLIFLNIQGTFMYITKEENRFYNIISINLNYERCFQKLMQIPIRHVCNTDNNKTA